MHMVRRGSSDVGQTGSLSDAGSRNLGLGKGCGCGGEAISIADSALDWTPGSRPGYWSCPPVVTTVAFLLESFAVTAKSAWSYGLADKPQEMTNRAMQVIRVLSAICMVLLIRLNRIPVKLQIRHHLCFLRPGDQWRAWGKHVDDQWRGRGRTWTT